MKKKQKRRRSSSRGRKRTNFTPMRSRRRSMGEKKPNLIYSLSVAKGGGGKKKKDMKNSFAIGMG